MHQPDDIMLLGAVPITMGDRFSLVVLNPKPNPKIHCKQLI